MARKPKYYVRPDGLHEAIRVVNGKRVAFRGSSDAEVERRMIEYRERLAKGRSFSEVAGEWESIHFPTLAANSLKNYRPALKRAIDEFGDESIKEIKAPSIKRFINEFAHGGRAWKTVTTQRLILSLVFDYAVTEGEIEYNPCASVKVPKGLAKSFRDAASIEDEERVKKYAKGWLLPYLILYTGLRKGEALGLTYDDIDRKNMVIWVRRSVYHTDDGKPYTKEPKTEAGERNVPIFDPLRKELPVGKGGKFIFSDDGGASPLSSWGYEKRWSEFVQKTGAACTAHNLRHSYATILFEMDVDAKIGKELLGHSTEAMTREIYTHLRNKKLEKEKQKINEKILAMEKERKQGNTQKLHRDA